MHSGIEYIISNFFLILFWMVAANLIFDNKYPKVITIILEVAIQFGFWYLFENVFPIFSALRFFVGFAMPILIMYFFHTDKPLFKITASLLLVMTVAISEVFSMALFPYEMELSGELFEKYAVPVYSIFTLLNLTIISIFTAVLMAVKRRTQGLIIEKQWFIFILFPASQLFSLYVWYAHFVRYGYYDTKMVIAMLAIDLLADAALIYTIRLTASNTELRIRSEMLEEQVHSQENYYNHIASTYADMRKMRHDIDNHFYAMEGLLERGEIQDAKDYIHKLGEQDKTDVSFSECRNTVVASYLEKKREDIIAAGIAFEANVYLPSVLNISNPDLICIYGNILDNAIEACRNTDNSKISLTTKYKNQYLTISCVNTVPTDRKEKKRRIPELERGIGFTILSSLADQYDGQFANELSDGMFRTEIILKDISPDNTANH